MKEFGLGANLPLVEEVRFPGVIKSRFTEIVNGVYPQEVIEQMRSEGYNPIIIGCEHTTFDLMSHIALLREIQEFLGERKVKVGLEILPPVQLQYIKEFLKDEAEYNQTSEIHGKKPSKRSVSLLNDYRSKLAKHHSESLALWLLENGFDVFTIDHEDAYAWIKKDQQMPAFNGEDWLDDFRGLAEYRPGYTAIRRDIFMLRRINTERPDLVSSGLYHALKFDLLMDHDGQNSVYLSTTSVEWDKILQMWASVHNLYKKNIDKNPG